MPADPARPRVAPRIALTALAAVGALALGVAARRCGGDPQLRAYADALDAYEEGRAALEGGDPARAAERFEDAREADPRSPLLVHWHARALAADGRLEPAIALLSDRLRDEPRDGLGWYNRAAYRARGHDVGGAATDLAEALRLGAASPVAAASDPDFTPLLGTPEFLRVLPGGAVSLVAGGPGGSVFVGSEFAVTLEITALPSAELVVRRGGEDPNCLRLLRLVEDEDAGGERRELAAWFRAEAGCEVGLGPWSVEARLPGGGLAHAGAPALPVLVEAPPGSVPALRTEGAFGGAAVLPLPSKFPPGAPASGKACVGRALDGEWTMGRAGDPYAPGPGGRLVRLELRVGGQTRAHGAWWPGAACGGR